LFFITACAEVCGDVLAFEGSAGIGFDASAGGSLINKSQDSSNSFTTSWSYSTSTDASLAGSQSDVFVVPNLHVAYNTIYKVFWNDQSCEPILDDGELPKSIEFDVEASDSKPAFSFYNRNFIVTSKFRMSLIHTLFIFSP